MLNRRNLIVQEHLKKFVFSEYGIELSSLTMETPPRRELGDLAFPFPFQLAKSLRKNPRAIAQDIVDQSVQIPGVDRVEAAGGGFLNVFFNRAEFLEDLETWLSRGESAAEGEKFIVEHTNINPNKAAHIGHLRNAILGDTFVRLLKASGKQVETQNYIDNTGVQVADVIVGFLYLRKMCIEKVSAIEDPFDFYCWDLYAEVSEWYKDDPDKLELRQKTLTEIEEGTNDTARLSEIIVDRIVRAHLKTMNRIGVKYDILPRESEILHLKFWETAFSQLKETDAVYFATEGPHKGCWVMSLSEDTDSPDEDKILVRSNGTVTYVGKDIAYQLWKFGLLGKTFHYQKFSQYKNGHQIWVTACESDEPDQPSFGSGQQVFNVIDVRQSYLQRVVAQGLRSLGFRDEADRSVHFFYEMVALSPRCCEDLGIHLSEEDKKKSYVEVSGRKGLGVKADDLIDTLIEKALKEVNNRNSGLTEEKRKEVAEQIAVGALRYFMLKYTRNAVIAFDLNEALSFEGETGPYLQYSVVRSNNIFRKIQERDSDWDGPLWLERREKLQGSSQLAEFLEDNESWGLILEVARVEEAVQQAIDTLEISTVARHAFMLAQQFNLFYHKHHILSEEDELRKTFYLAVADTARKGLTKIVNLLGIEVPERM
jgi:arginyl-tRNA synthetase